MAHADDADRNLIATIPYDEDAEVHVATVEKAGFEFLDIREYIPSVAEYGRGITLPRRVAEPVIEALVKVWR